MEKGMSGKNKQQQYGHHCLAGLTRANKQFMGSQKWERSTGLWIQSFLVRGRGFVWPGTVPGLCAGAGCATPHCPCITNVAIAPSW